MPTYEYACRSCGLRVEVVQSFNDEPLETCSRCSGALRRVFHPAGVLFRGPGFYSTDARSRSSRPAGDGEAAKKGESSGNKEKAPATGKDSKGSGSGGSSASSGPNEARSHSASSSAGKPA